MNEQTTDKYNDLLSDPPAYAEATAHLFSWSANYDHGRKPIQAFLDIIGHSMEQGYGNLFCWDTCGESFGYMEIDDLADALKEYAERPTDVNAYVNEVLAAEFGDEEEPTEA